MEFEQPEFLNKIDLSHKLELQKLLMAEMLGASISDLQRLEWIDQYAKEVGEIIDEDSVLGERIRELALSENYALAASILKDELGNRKPKMAEVA